MKNKNALVQAGVIASVTNSDGLDQAIETLTDNEVKTLIAIHKKLNLKTLDIVANGGMF